MKTTQFRQTILIVQGQNPWCFRPLRKDRETGKWVDIDEKKLKPDRGDGYKYIITKMANIMWEDGWKTAVGVEERPYVCTADGDVKGVYRVFTLVCIKDEDGDEALEGDTEIMVKSLHDCYHNQFSKGHRCIRCGSHMDDLLRAG